MPTPLPARNIFDGTAAPVTSSMKTAMGSLRDYLAGLLGTTGAAVDARAALGSAASGANSDITSLSATGAISTTIASKTAALDAAGGSIFATLNDDTVNWRIGTGIQAAGKFSLYNVTGAVTAFTVDSAGDLNVGRSVNVGGGGVIAGILNVVTTAAGHNTAFKNFSDAGYGLLFYDSSQTVRGSITWTNTTTTYNTSSDYRLKEDIEPLVGALARISALKPVTYKWRVNGSTGEGFIAHELQAVVPDCVTGKKDAVDEKGEPVYQGIDTSFLVATLTAAIQEQQAMIQALTARIEALE